MLSRTIDEKVHSASKNAWARFSQGADSSVRIPEIKRASHFWEARLTSSHFLSIGE